MLDKQIIKQQFEFLKEDLALQTLRKHFESEKPLYQKSKKYDYVKSRVMDGNKSAKVSRSTPYSNQKKKLPKVKNKFLTSI